MQEKAVVLISGGLDSATTLFLAHKRGYDCYALTINYGQRSQAELNAAKKVCQQSVVKEHRIVHVDLEQFGGSALTDRNIHMPEGHDPDCIPTTYVPARNTIFLSMAISYAETLQARDIFFGAHVYDYSNYPDCRPEYFAAFTKMAALATKIGVENGEETFRIQTPLLYLNKTEIIQLGTAMGIDYGQTISCYDATPEGLACGVCPSCDIRKTGFARAGIADPTAYKKIVPA